MRADRIAIDWLNPVASRARNACSASSSSRTEIAWAMTMIVPRFVIHLQSSRYRITRPDHDTGSETEPRDRIRNIAMLGPYAPVPFAHPLPVANPYDPAKVLPTPLARFLHTVLGILALLAFILLIA